MIRLDEFLERICFLPDERENPVWIYECCGSENPEDPDRELMAIFMGGYNPHVTISERLCKLEIKEICWTWKGIVVVVEEMDNEQTD